MFSAAMLYSCPGLEMSIYSTCKVHCSSILVRNTALLMPYRAAPQRISQKLLRNVQKFLDLIYIEMGTKRMKEIRINMEEIVLLGEEHEQDVRMVTRTLAR